MADDGERIASLARELVRDLGARGMTIALAESCTGGWVAKAITDVPGSSDCFGYGIVSYSNEAKTSLLAVPAGTLAGHGAVSEAVVRAMADGALQLSGADLAVAVSGIAGPDGGSADKPVGTVWFAWARRSGAEAHTEAERHLLTGDRGAVRAQSVVLALAGARERIQARV